MQDNDGILSLLQDIKRILYGIFLFLAGSLLSMVGVVLGGLIAALALLAGLPILLVGVLYVREGWRAHNITEKQS